MKYLTWSCLWYRCNDFTCVATSFITPALTKPVFSLHSLNVRLVSNAYRASATSSSWVSLGDSACCLRYFITWQIDAHMSFWLRRSSKCCGLLELKVQCIRKKSSRFPKISFVQGPLRTVTSSVIQLSSVGGVTVDKESGDKDLQLEGWICSLLQICLHNTIYAIYNFYTICMLIKNLKKHK